MTSRGGWYAEVERSHAGTHEEQERAPRRAEPLLPATALAWQQAAGNQAVARTLADRRALLRAGDPQGMMKDHPGTRKEGRKLGDDPPDYTYHHIIPENILKKFWTKVSGNADDSGKISAGLTSMVKRGYTQLRSSARYSLTERLRSELGDLVSDAGKIGEIAEATVRRLLPEGDATATPGFDDEVDRVVTAAGAGSMEASALVTLKQALRTHISSVVEAVDVEGAQTEATVTADPLASGAPVTITEQMITWMPGNIHQGPSSKLRRNPASQGFNEETDDGGNKFEVAARHLISTEQYATLKSLCQKMEAYTAPPKQQPRGKKGGGAAQEQAAPTTDELLVEIQQLLTDLTAYSVTEWSSVKDRWNEEDSGMWRIKPPSAPATEESQTEAVVALT